MVFMVALTPTVSDGQTLFSGPGVGRNVLLRQQPRRPHAGAGMLVSGGRTAQPRVVPRLRAEQAGAGSVAVKVCGLWLLKALICSGYPYSLHTLEKNTYIFNIVSMKLITIFRAELGFRSDIHRDILFSVTLQEIIFSGAKASQQRRNAKC